MDFSYSEAHLGLGRIELTEGRMERAVKELSTAATQDPASELPHYLLAKVYLQVGNTEEANRETILFQQLRARRKGQDNAVLKELLGKSGIEQLVEDEP